MARVRSSHAFVFALVSVLALLPASAGAVGAAVWGVKQNDHAYYQQHTYESAQDPVMSPGQAYAAAPSALSNFHPTDGTLAFIEGGITKQCNGCNRHAYASWARYGDPNIYGVDENSIAVAPADYLPFYEANKGGSGGLNWASCVGWNGQWLTMAYVNLNWSYTLPYAANGGESDCFACPLGFSRHSQLQFDKGTGWQNWMCYDTTFIWNGPDGSNITGCSNNSFDTNYK